MTHGSLFSGIGGFDLAAEWAGWTNIFLCEKETFCQRVLNYYWPTAELIPNITNYDFAKYANRISVLTGGFPCQPFSLAGERKGTNDDRYLWPEMLRAIREIAPKWVVGENVYGLVNWDRGLVFQQVQLDLEAEGYTVQPYILPACSKDAPHRRDRVWFIAHTNNTGQGRKITGRNEQTVNVGTPRFNALEYVTNTLNSGLQGDKRGESFKERFWQKTFRPITKRFKIPTWDKWPSQPPVCGGDDGIPNKLDGITIPKWRQESIKSFGNAIVPQVALEIFKVINKIEEYEKAINSNNNVNIGNNNKSPNTNRYNFNKHNR